MSKPKIPEYLTLHLMVDANWERFWFGCPPEDWKWWITTTDASVSRRPGYILQKVCIPITDENKAGFGYYRKWIKPREKTAQ